MPALVGRRADGRRADGRRADGRRGLIHHLFVLAALAVGARAGAAGGVARCLKYIIKNNKIHTPQPMPQPWAMPHALKDSVSPVP